MNRRSLLQMLGVGMGVAVATPAWAQKIRILPGAGEGAPSAGGDQALAEVRRVLAGVRVGERRAHAGLTVFWLHAPAASTSWAVSTLDEARAQGRLIVSERDQAAVSDLVIENRGPVYVLLLAGRSCRAESRAHRGRGRPDSPAEPPLTASHCVEQGRCGSRRQFSTRETLAAPRLREKMLDAPISDKCGPSRPLRQAWQPHRRRAATRRSPPPEVQAQQKDVEAAIGGAIAPGAQGAAITSATPAGLDLFRTARCSRASGRNSAREHDRSVRRKVADPDESRLRTASTSFEIRRGSRRLGQARRRRRVARRARMSRAKGSALVAESQVVRRDDRRAARPACGPLGAGRGAASARGSPRRTSASADTGDRASAPPAPEP